MPNPGLWHDAVRPIDVRAGLVLCFAALVKEKAVKRISIIAAALALAIACKVEKTGNDTYKVVAPTPEAKAAAQKAGEKARETIHDASVAVGKKTEAPVSGSKTETTSTTATTTNGTTETTSSVTTTKHKKH